VSKHDHELSYNRRPKIASKPYRSLHYIVVVLANHWQVVRCRNLDWGHRRRSSDLSMGTDRCRYSRNVTPFITLRLLFMTYTCLEAAKTTKLHLLYTRYMQSTFIRSSNVFDGQQLRPRTENGYRFSRSQCSSELSRRLVSEAITTHFDVRSSRALSFSELHISDFTTIGYYVNHSLEYEPHLHCSTAA
jgi:hypothetical protein